MRDIQDLLQDCKYRGHRSYRVLQSKVERSIQNKQVSASRDLAPVYAGIQLVIPAQEVIAEQHVKVLSGKKRGYIEIVDAAAHIHDQYLGVPRVGR